MSPLNSVTVEPKTYIVRKGDTLCKMAKTFSIGLAEIKELNNIKSSRIKLGQVLLLEQQLTETENGQIAETEKMQVRNTKDFEEIEKIMNAPESKNSKIKELLIFVAKQTLGIAYRFGSNTFMGTDCSGYVQKEFSLFGINLPRSAREQFQVGDAVERKIFQWGILFLSEPTRHYLHMLEFISGIIFSFTRQQLAGR